MGFKPSVTPTLASFPNALLSNNSDTCEGPKHIKAKHEEASK